MAEASLADNPLLKPSQLPYGAPPFDQIKTEHFEPAIMEGIRLARAGIEAIKKNSADPTFENTIEAFENAHLLLNKVNYAFNAMVRANGDQKLRKLKSPISIAVTKYDDDVFLDVELFQHVKAVYDVRDSLTLTPEQKMLLKDTYKRFIDNGIHLNDEKKAKVRELNERIADLEEQFENNVTEDAKKRGVLVENEEDLTGLSQHLKDIYAGAAEKAGHPGKWLIGVPQPLDFLMNCDNRALRQKVQNAWDSIASEGEFDNRAIGLELVQLRHRFAQILGYKNFADYILEDRMLNSAQEVKALLDRNEAAYRTAFANELKELTNYAQRKDGLSELKQWDILYYQNKLKQEKFQLDMEEVRQYFDLEKVLEGVRTHAEKLFNIEMREINGVYQGVHPDVKVYEVIDKEKGQVIGVFYADYYARPGLKDTGAWASSLRKRCVEGGEGKIPLVLNTCNFSKPKDGQPTLLSLKDVITLFHEFGHALHNLLAEGRYASLTGTAVSRDFVELPSQVQENWVLQKEVLNTFARHVKTGALMPDDLIKKMKDTVNFDAGYRGLRQTFFGQLDYALYNSDPSKIESLTALEDDVRENCGYFERGKGVGGQINYFTHILSGGYTMGYYSYKWSEVLDADVFSLFEKNGLYHHETALRLRRLYAKGGTEEAIDIYKEMMARGPDPQAMFREEGLLGGDGASADQPTPKRAANGGAPGRK